jgi:copper chaperone CopZ
LTINGYRLKIAKRRENNRENGKQSGKVEWKVADNRHTFRVEGMTCNHCKASVEKGISKLDQVKGVWADPGRNQVIIEAGTLSEAEVQATVEGLGYVFRGRIEGG